MLINEAIEKVREIRDALAPKDDEAMIVVAQAILELKRLILERKKHAIPITRRLA